MSDYKIQVDWGDPYDVEVETITGSVSGSNVTFSISHEYTCPTGSAATVVIYCDPTMVQYIDIQNLDDAQPQWYSSLSTCGLSSLKTLTVGNASNLATLDCQGGSVSSLVADYAVLTSVSLANNNMAASVVDAMIIEIDSLSTSSGILDIRSNSAPTSCSASARQSLLDRGWTCYYDS